jgi:hypothetical protein
MARPKLRFGKRPHDLLQTVFSAPIDHINAELLTDGCDGKARSSLAHCDYQ